MRPRSHASQEGLFETTIAKERAPVTIPAIATARQRVCLAMAAALVPIAASAGKHPRIPDGGRRANIVAVSPRTPAAAARRVENLAGGGALSVCMLVIVPVPEGHPVIVCVS